MIKVLENEFYYLDNFHRVLAWLGERYADLLDDQERAFIDTFPTLPRPSRALLVRMVMRKGELFRASKLAYREIGCPHAAALPLAAQGWIEADPVLDIDALCELLLKPELAALFALTAHEKQWRKAELLDALRARHPEARAFSAWCGAHDEQAYRLCVQPLCDRLRLIFFGNGHQSWTDFVLSDLGIYRFEQVDCGPASRAFRHRADVDAYLALHACRVRVHDGEAPATVLPDLPASSDNPWLQGRRDKLLFQMAQQQEKLGAWDDAYALYGACAYPGARARAIRVLEKLERDDAAYALLDCAQRAPESEGERQQLLRIAPRLRRKLGLAKLPAAVAAPVQRLDLQLPPPSADGWHVEGVVREHLQHGDAPVYYVENALINSLFGLLCWDAVFSAIPGAFFHPYHHGPADLYSADFRQRRATQFDACLAQLDDGRYRDTIRRNYGAKAGIQSPFVYWGALDAALLDLALDCIPAAHLKKWCERILLDVKDNCTGFPDLIQFWPAERRYHMIEVKGPGDRLQDNQLRWIGYCAQHGMPVAVCYLQWAA